MDTGRGSGLKGSRCCDMCNVLGVVTSITVRSHASTHFEVHSAPAYARSFYARSGVPEPPASPAVTGAGMVLVGAGTVTLSQIDTDVSDTDGVEAFGVSGWRKRRAFVMLRTFSVISLQRPAKPSDVIAGDVWQGSGCIRFRRRVCRVDGNSWLVSVGAYPRWMTPRRPTR
jgi:hypothetical protein